MARLIKRELPDFELHASTQMVAHSLEDVKYLEGVGFDRVVLAREVTVEEIKYICDNCKADIEVFVHGALCVCYSGQCLMSSMIGNRSGIEEDVRNLVDKDMNLLMYIQEKL